VRARAGARDRERKGERREREKNRIATSIQFETYSNFLI
jgi:hypothetical protein